MPTIRHIKIMNAINFLQRMEQLIALTVLGQISWTCVNYNPIAYCCHEGKEAENDCLMQLFNINGATPQGQILHFEISDYIMLQTGKGDILVEFSNDQDGCAVSLSAFKEYDSCSAGELLDKFQLTPIVRFVDSILPAAITDTESGQLMQEHPLYLPERIMKAEHLEDPLVKLALHLSEDGRILDFHKAVLDCAERDRLMRSYGIR